jgi:hypothetical protein
MVPPQARGGYRKQKFAVSESALQVALKSVRVSKHASLAIVSNRKYPLISLIRRSRTAHPVRQLVWNPVKLQKKQAFRATRLRRAAR